MNLVKIRAALAALWHREPVLIGTALPVLVTIGVLTQDQATVLTNAITGLVAVAAEVAAAFGVRAKVTPVKAAK